MAAKGRLSGNGFSRSCFHLDRSCSFSHASAILSWPWLRPMSSKSCTKLSPWKEAWWCKILLLNCSCQDHVTPKCGVNMAISGLEDLSLHTCSPAAWATKFAPNQFVSGWARAATTPVWHVKCSFQAIWCEDMAPGSLSALHGPSTLQAFRVMGDFKQSGRRKLVSDTV